MQEPRAAVPTTAASSHFSEHVTVLKGFGSFAVLTLTESRVVVRNWPKWARILGHVGLGVFIIELVNRVLRRDLNFVEAYSLPLDESFRFRKTSFGFNPNILQLEHEGIALKIAVSQYAQWASKLNAALGGRPRSA